MRPLAMCLALLVSDPMTRITSIVFDEHEHPKRALIRTKYGTVKVEWVKIGGDRCWFTSGSLDATKLVFEAIQKIGRLFSPQ